MGFAVYRPSKNWTPADFDTGSDKIAASLANIPRQIFEGIQLRKENELKDRAMADKEKQTELEKERDFKTEIHQDKMEQRAADSQRLEEERLRWQNYNAAKERETEKAWRDVQERRFKFENEKTRMETRALQFRMDQAAKEGNLEGLQVSLKTDLEAKRSAVNNYLASFSIPNSDPKKPQKGLFTDPQLNAYLQGMVGKEGVDPIKIIERIAIQRQGDLNLFNKDALSVLSPMIEGVNTASNNLWLSKFKQPDPSPLPTFYEPMVKTNAYNASIGDLDEKDPRVAATLQLLTSTGMEEESKLKAAISDVLHNRPANTLLYGKTLHQKISNTLKAVMRSTEVEKRKKTKEAETYAEGLGYPFQ
jgi:hypothetical protein